MTGSLTAADVFDLLAEHAECWCSDGEQANGVVSEECPKHLAIKALTDHSGDATTTIPQSLFPLAHLSGYSRVWDGETPRVVIALLVWRIVAEFTRDPAPLQVPPDQTITATAERYVMDHADAAEQEDIEYDGETEVITYVMNRTSLLDDYLRIKHNVQHMAFETTENQL